MIRVQVEGVAGNRLSEHFLIDTGADRTVFSAYFHQQLGLPAMTGIPATSLTGISGSTNSVAVSAVLEFIALDGRTVRVSGNFAAFTDLAATDYSILGRNVLDIFDVIVSRRQSEVRLLTPNHTTRYSAIEDSGTSIRMKYAICNETFEDWDHARVCKFVAETGYTGLELAPFTLAPIITDVSPARRRELRQQAEGAGLRILGLHWLLAKTEGFQLTSNDAGVRQRTAEYLIELAKCCRDVGGDLMVFGSPAQRRIPAGATRAVAVDNAVDTFNRAKKGVGDCGVKLCLEPLAPAEADFINSAAEGVEILDRVNHPNFCLHLDVKAMSSEAMPVADVIRKYIGRTGHFHANDPNKRGPGFGQTDFKPIFKALRESNYQGWVSVEVFDYSPDPETIARDSLRYMRECEHAS